MNLDALQIIFLAILQGLTEFLPVSSSGHLLLPSLLLGWADQGLSFDVAVHVGSLFAVLAYFKLDIAKLTIAWLGSFNSSSKTDDAKLAWLLIIATIPVALAGLLLRDAIEQYGRSVLLIALSSIGFALLLLWSEYFSNRKATLKDLTWKSALFIGLAQMLALIPGTSRSGVTMTAGLFCHLNRASAARFSFLLAIPTIFASGLFTSVELFTSDVSPPWFTLILAASISGLVAYSCIHFFLGLIERVGFLPFVIYRLLLGGLLLAIYL